MFAVASHFSSRCCLEHIPGKERVSIYIIYCIISIYSIVIIKLFYTHVLTQACSFTAIPVLCDSWCQCLGNSRTKQRLYEAALLKTLQVKYWVVIVWFWPPEPHLCVIKLLFVPCEICCLSCFQDSLSHVLENAQWHRTSEVFSAVLQPVPAILESNSDSVSKAISRSTYNMTITKDSCN